MEDTVRPIPTEGGEFCMGDSPDEGELTMNADAKYPELSANALAILSERYLRGDENPDDMFRRVAEAVARAEPKETRAERAEEFFSLMRSLRFLPNSPTLVNAGVEGAGSLSACYTISPDDSMASIMRVATDAAMIEKSGGGVGFGFGSLRPRYDRIASVQGIACGPVAVMKLYSEVGRTLTQGAFREGAHMGQLPVSHPDIREFIHCKDSDTELANFNISVQVTDEFMRKVEEDGEWELINPRDRGNGPENCVSETVRAREIWDEIAKSAWKTGDPGLVFIDRVHDTAPNPQLGEIRTSNPCSEEFMEDYGNCCLGSVNLAAHLLPDRSGLDMDALSHTIESAVRFLDDVTEVNEFPIERLREMNLATRRIGLGVMGWADALCEMGIPYDSRDAIELASKTSWFITAEAWKHSAELAAERGPFPEWQNSALRKKMTTPVRHSSVTTIAPTGTISRIAGCSSGIEPYFAVAWRSRVLWGEGSAKAEMIDAPPMVRLAVEGATRARHGIHAPEIAEVVLAELIDEPQKLREYMNADLMRTAAELSPDVHILMQAAWQKHVTNGVSKTVNLPNSAKEKDIADVYLAAWKTGCKAVCVYRDGSKSEQVLETAETKRARAVTMEDQPPESELNADTRIRPEWDGRYIIPIPRPRSLPGRNHRQESASGRMYIGISDYNDGMFEVFINLAKSDSVEQAHLEAVSRLISLALRSGVSPEDVIAQLEGITSESIWEDGTPILSPEDGVAKTMLRHMRESGEGNQVDVTAPKPIADAPAPKSRPGRCPRPGCYGQAIYAEGCLSCPSCGFSKCG